MKRLLAILIARGASAASRLIGNAGTSLPGMWATKIDPHILSKLGSEVSRGIVVVTGTNGKTTTANLIAHILSEAGYRVISNKAGSNMYNGIVSAFLLSAPLRGRLAADYAVLEVDEFYTVPVCRDLTPLFFVVTNLFSDQIDRFGSVDEVRATLARALESVMSSKTTLVLNADNPASARLSTMVSFNEIFYTADQDDTVDRSGDSPVQDSAYYATDIEEDRSLSFDTHTPAGAIRIRTLIRGSYNVSNLMAAIVVATEEGVPLAKIASAVEGFETQPGRMESFLVSGRPVVLNMTKNPAGVNRTLEAAAGGKGSYDVFIVVNNTAADGVNLAWYDEIEFEQQAQRAPSNYYVSGTCSNEMAERIRAAGVGAHRIRTVADPATGLRGALQGTAETLYILANYSAVFSVRKQLVALSE
jgi:UDP-N-acetylmuramyl tripeptide synthase